jgi:hypothetical protein
MKEKAGEYGPRAMMDKAADIILLCKNTNVMSLELTVCIQAKFKDKHRII